MKILAFIGILWIIVPQKIYYKGQYTQAQNITAYHMFGCDHTKDDLSICTQVLDQNNTKLYEGLLIEIRYQ